MFLEYVSSLRRGTPSPPPYRRLLHREDRLALPFSPHAALLARNCAEQQLISPDQPGGGWHCGRAGDADTAPRR